jgi:mono/diheme cytochrome c family protein
MRQIRIIAVCSVIGVCVFAAIEIPGDARRGEELFRTQQCIECHSVNGKGGTSAPDLGRRVGRRYTPALMVSFMWNHAPAMWSTMESKGITRPQLDTEQAADLFAYFYSARYFEEPGDAGRGKQVFQSKRCAQCHGLSEALGAGAKPVVAWKSLNDPILLAQEMWNHSAQMKEAFAKRKISWLRLTSQELSDLLVYLQNLPQTRGRRAEFAPASAETGQMLFELKGCVGCHTGKLSLQNRFANRTLTDFAVAMWNHAPKMATTFPELRTEEMRRIVGYLWSQQLFGERGRPGRGKKVYSAKKCATCHEDASSGAPGLAGRKPALTALSMVSVLWKHGPAMRGQMERKKIAWPKFTGSDMADLLAYLQEKR